MALLVSPKPVCFIRRRRVTLSRGIVNGRARDGLHRLVRRSVTAVPLRLLAQLPSSAMVQRPSGPSASQPPSRRRRDVEFATPSAVPLCDVRCSMRRLAFVMFIDDVSRVSRDALFWARAGDLRLRDFWDDCATSGDDCTTSGDCVRHCWLRLGSLHSRREVFAQPDVT
ncbi:hypothetical protein H6P81_010419 [Aristolochia fimbriata]|uniref:Uncharacterized protein n=1 Tax=Aristolochia fimbriata TaxID=158543 RepID=A0AAV7EPC8_ARIFI|nr:hypothetical protein H6P81_010419 [Aristolochia fimbriata]